MKIKDLCVDERPREKMLGKGASSLSNAELIAILLRTGTERKNALEVAQMLLNIRRLCSEVPDSRKIIIHQPADVYRELIPIMRGLHHEECWIIYLARNNRIISKERLSIGGQSETIVEVKSVVRRALDVRAASVIISHNHPSGDPHPGNADIRLTQNLKKALETFDISLVDHVIFADGRYYSFADEMEYGI